MKKMSFRSIFNWLYAKTLDRAMSERQPREDRETISPVYRPVCVSYVSRTMLVTLFLLLLGGWNTQAWGQTYNNGVWYSLYNTNEYSADTWKTSGESIHTYSGAFVPNDGTFSFEAKLPGNGDSGKESSDSDPHDWGVDNFDITFAGIRKTVSQNVTLTRTERSGSGKWYDPYRYIYYYSYNYQFVSSSGLSSESTSFEARYEYKLKNTLKKVYIRNVKVPMAKHIRLADGTSSGTTSIANVSLGTAYVGQTSTTSYHINLRSFLMNGTQIKFVSSNEDFHFGDNKTTKIYNVLANSCAAAGGKADCASDNTNLGNPDNYEADVYFTPKTNKTGESKATITIYDGNTKRATITFTANVLPTYYFKAIAVATDGSQAVAADVKASFTSGSYTSASVTAHEVGANTNTANITKRAYFYAPTQYGDYYFQGWYADAACTGTRLSTEQTLERDITATSLNSDSPTEGKYHALYKQIIRAEFSGAGQSLMVDGSYNGISYIRTSRESAGTKSSDGFWYEIRNNTPSGNTTGSTHPSQIISYNPSTKVVTAHNAGTATLVLHQEGVGVYEDIDQEYTFTVYKYNSIFANVANLNVKVDGNVSSSYTLTYEKPNAAYIGDANHSAGTPVLGASESNFYYTLAQDVQTSGVTTGSDQPTWAIAYDAANKKATGKNAGKGTVHLYQPETYKYNAADASFDVNVTKYDNAFSCSWDGWTKTVNFDEVVDADFTAKNTNYTLCPINITQTRGEKVATLKRVDATNNTITASYNRDYATWHLSQAESYKYKAAEADVTLVVNTITTNCNFYEKSDQREIGAGKEWEVVTWTGNYAKEISFQAAKNMATAIGDLQLYILLEGGTWQLYKSIGVGDLDGSWGNYDFGSKYFTYSLASNVRGIKFKNNGDYSRAIRNLTIKRIQYLKLSESEITMPTNTLGGNKQEATFTIDYSTCAETIKVVSNHPHITVSETSFETNGNETKTIKVTYACNVTEVIDAVITVYTPYENKTIAVHAETEKQTPEIIWNEGYQGNPISLPVGLSTDAAANASNSQPIIYTSGDPSIIAVSADGRSFEVVGKGSTTLTATSTEDTEGQWKSVSDTKNVNTTDKKIQVIVWEQTFTRGLHEGDVIPMTAKVYLQDLKTGTNTFSSERTSMLQYSISEPNEVVEITDGYKLNILGYGETTVTASVAGDEDYEAAVSVGKQVRVREIPTGDCETPLVMAPEDNGEIEFFAFDLAQPAITKLVTIDRSKGVPDKLSFYVRGVSYNMAVEYYNNGIEVYESTDGGVTWSSQLIYAYPLKNTTGYYGPIQLSPNATHLKFFRAQGGRGYHYVGDIQITAKQFIENDYTIVNGMPQLDLQNVSAGAVKESSVDFRYSDVKGFLNASTSSSSNPRNVLTLSEDQIETECGEIGSYSLPITFRPMVVGPWQTTVTITDPKTSKSTTVRVVATVTQGSQSITWNPEKTSFGANETPNILNATASSELPVSYTITSGASVAEIRNGVVVILQPGTFTITASQNGSPDFYAAKPVTKTFTVSAIPLILTAPTASSINASQTLNESDLTGGSAVDSKGNEVAGTWAWQNSSATYSAGEHTPAVVFTPSTNPAWYSNTTTTTALTVTGVEYIFTNSAGDSEWDEASNWAGGNKPSGNDKDVIIRGNLTIDDTVVVKSLTIEENYNVTLTVGGQLTVGDGDSQDRAKYGDLHVLKGGQVVLNEGKLKVNNFILDASLNGLDAEAQVQAAASGQVTNPGNIDQQGNAYFDLSFDPSGKISYGWYDFTVPFEVNISGGISRINSATDKVMVCGTDFLIMEDDEANYVAGGKGWHQIYGGVLQPGKLYTITFDDEVNQNTFRFTWNGHGSLENGSSFNAEYHVSSDETRTGWNALGNGMLQHGYLNSGLKVQTYDHTRNTYNVLNQHSTFAIGTAFLVQVPSAQKLNWTVAEATNDRPLYAPQREAREVEEFRITLGADEMHLSDVLYFSASEETTDAYVIGHDLVKRGTPQEAKDAQIWATKGGKNLCDIEATLYNNSASTPLSLYAPQNGQYTLAIDQAPEDANLYLTYNGSVIWDLTASPYSLDLTKGTTEGYGLQLEVINASQITTGVDEINGEKEGNRKVLINNAMYIITKEGAIFNATGKKVK